MKKRLILFIFLLGACIVLSSCNNDRNKVESTTVETTEKPQETTTETTTGTTTEPEETSSLADLPWV